MLPQKIKSAAGGIAMSSDRSTPRIVDSHTQHRTSEMNRRKQAYFRNSVELRDRVEVRTLRKRLQRSPSPFKDVVRKAGSSISAVSKEAGRR